MFFAVSKNPKFRPNAGFFVQNAEKFRSETALKAAAVNGRFTRSNLPISAAVL
jgi:hypothetical protein